MDEKLQKKVDNFFIQFTPLHLPKREIFIHADESPNDIYYLKEGMVRQYAISPEGTELTVNIYKPISFFPLMEAITGLPNKYYFETMMDCQMWRAPQDQMLTFLKENPDIMYDLLNRLYRGMHGLLLRIEYLMAGDARLKVIFTLLNAAARFGKQDTTEVHIPLRITHKDLGTIAGVTRETFSREIKKLEKKGLVNMNKQTIILTDMDKLHEELLN